MESSLRPRKTASLSESVHRQLNMYTLAASATGVSLLALAQPSEAKVVYTETHKVIGTNGIYELDLNHDGTGDFLIQQWGYPSQSGSGYNWLLAKPALGNAVETSGSGRAYFARALKRGARIGPGQRFRSKGGSLGEVMLSVVRNDVQGGTYGPWVNAPKRYLGLRFKIDGKTHYGWARLSVHNQGFYITAVLTGYAYETVPNKSLRAGQTADGGENSTTGPLLGHWDASLPRAAVADPISNTMSPGSLGTLALGAQGVPLRRRP